MFVLVKLYSNISNLVTAALLYLLNMTRSTLHTRSFRRIHLSVIPFGVTKNSFARPKSSILRLFRNRSSRLGYGKKSTLVSTFGIKKRKTIFSLFYRVMETRVKVGEEEKRWGNANASFWLYRADLWLILCVNKFSQWFVIKKCYDYQSRKARRSFGDEVLDLHVKLRGSHGYSLPMVTISSPAISRAFLPSMSKADKLPLDMEPVTRAILKKVER